MCIGLDQASGEISFIYFKAITSLKVLLYIMDWLPLLRRKINVYYNLYIQKLNKTNDLLLTKM